MLNYDPALVSLFAHSPRTIKSAAIAGPRSGSRSTTIRATKPSTLSSDVESEGIDVLWKTSLGQGQINFSNTGHREASFFDHGSAESASRRRKSKDREDDLENRYLSEMARKELMEDQDRYRTLRNKRQKMESHSVPSADTRSPNQGHKSTSNFNTITVHEANFAAADVPQHESMVASKADFDLDKLSRTVFLANVSTMAITSKKARKTLMDHLTSFNSSLPVNNGRHHIESLRFRSIAFASCGTPKKAAFAKKQIMESTTRSTNAYVVYTTELAARKAVTSLNGSTVLDRHLRVDSVACPAKIDHRKCVFVGNLGFVDDTNVKPTQNPDNKRSRKVKEPADFEEGLWRLFEKVGVVESVRIVRDKMTRIGKGFAYVQFKDANSVEKALLYHEKKLPPMLPRILRVTRAKNTKSATTGEEGRFSRNIEPINYRSNAPLDVQSLTGRAHKLLGRADAAKLQTTERQYKSPSKSGTALAESLGSAVSEGLRASRSQGKGFLRPAHRKHSKPSNRSRAFRKQGRKKTRL